MDAGAAEYPLDCGRVCKTEAAAGEKYYHHNDAWTLKRGTTYMTKKVKYSVIKHIFTN